jgi:hypothetical protein
VSVSFGGSLVAVFLVGILSCPIVSEAKKATSQSEKFNLNAQVWLPSIPSQRQTVVSVLGPKLKSPSVSILLRSKRGGIYGTPKRVGVHSLGIESGENESRKPTAACGHSTVCAYQLEWQSFGGKAGAHCLSGVTKTHGAGATSTVGEDQCQCSSSDHETQAHYVSISPPEDCGVSKGKVGEGEGAAEEGGLGGVLFYALPDTLGSPIYLARPRKSSVSLKSSGN